ncbi:biotin--[acetyl-CoA-carboxylase] ligase [Pollutimonas harenae]|uniref:biotin--[biotin carboxyl-carrier protein] ligase n=1 Tax=Pollutimonas harenae TaxID=657015 RepID=A0A853H2B1_9BURK|nr:biotin--[acetyl-CoA-carboxylase] ligase [Pollutimonas harenae]NYT84294.1 biotin--[acetyl-CoA-carboxylase] ligase [Pollutimonas harenae]TEA73300.1 biotin--[acetyl-CoA-carboxylase] ligase [Pollutimonas harenae]
MTISTPLHLPDPEQMLNQVSAALPHFRQVRWVQTTHSTNADLLAMARSTSGPLARPWLLGAHLQERGRGRAGRNWQNRPGANLMFSCAFDVFLPPKELPTLSPLAGLAACEALRELISPEQRGHLTMKWPNDLQWQSAKLAGILVEVSRAGTARLSPDHHVAIIGMGLNLDDARALSTSLNRKVADWSEITAKDSSVATVPAAGLVARIAQSWYDCLNQVTAHGLDFLPERYAQVDALLGQHVNILDDGRLLQAGIACGVNRLGQLLLRSPQGEQAVTVGEVSVRPQSEVTQP